MFMYSLDTPSIRLKGKARPCHGLATTMNVVVGQVKDEPLKATTNLMVGNWPKKVRCLWSPPEAVAPLHH